MNNGMTQQLELIKNEEGRELHKGFTLGGWEVAKGLLSDKWKLKSEWCDGLFRKAWINYEQRGIFTYCEGDIILEAFKTKQHFDAAIERANEFYSKY
jgi:hypothetical protein